MTYTPTEKEVKAFERAWNDTYSTKQAQIRAALIAAYATREEERDDDLTIAYMCGAEKLRDTIARLTKERDEARELLVGSERDWTETSPPASLWKEIAAPEHSPAPTEPDERDRDKAKELYSLCAKQILTYAEICAAERTIAIALSTARAEGRMEGLEEAAKVADTSLFEPPVGPIGAAQRIATAIRSLKDKDND